MKWQVVKRLTSMPTLVESVFISECVGEIFPMFELGQRSLLKNCVHLETNVLDEAARAVTRAWIPHKMEFITRGEPFNFRINFIQHTQISIGFVTQRGRLRIKAAPNRSSYFLRLRFGGSCDHHLAGQVVPLSKDWTVVQSLQDSAETVTDEYLQILGLAIEETAVNCELEKILNHRLGERVKFAPGMNMRTILGSAFRRDAVRLFLEVDKKPRGYTGAGLGIKQLEQSILSLLIEGHRHNYTRLLHRGTLAAPWQVRQVEEFIRENAHVPLSLGDLCANVGINARTLQLSFHKHRNCSPMQFLRAVRLERVHAELLTSEAQTSVSATAARWGFLHWGRFAAEYRKRFGETPSTTLRRHKSLPA